MQSIPSQEYSSVPEDTGELSLSCDLSDKLVTLRRGIQGEIR